MKDQFKQIEKALVPANLSEKKDEPKVEQIAAKVKEKFEQVQPATQPQADITDISSPTKASTKPARVQQIEHLLAEGLESFYLQLPPEQRQKFKQDGEVAAKKINNLLQQAKIKIKEIIDIIRSWLRTVPGLNRFFVEQSAKIKADKILIISGKSKED